MSITVVLNLFPTDLTLEYNRRNIKRSCNTDINSLLKSPPNWNKIGKEASSFRKQINSETINKILLNLQKRIFIYTQYVIRQKNMSDQKMPGNCIFWMQNYFSETCNTFNVERKKHILKPQSLWHKPVIQTAKLDWMFGS